jgi:hypothetical protein
MTPWVNCSHRRQAFSIACVRRRSDIPARRHGQTCAVKIGQRLGPVGCPALIAECHGWNEYQRSLALASESESNWFEIETFLAGRRITAAMISRLFSMLYNGSGCRGAGDAVPAGGAAWGGCGNCRVIIRPNQS